MSKVLGEIKLDDVSIQVIKYISHHKKKQIRSVELAVGKGNRIWGDLTIQIKVDNIDDLINDLVAARDWLAKEGEGW